MQGLSLWEVSLSDGEARMLTVATAILLLQKLFPRCGVRQRQREYHGLSVSGCKTAGHSSAGNAAFYAASVFAVSGHGCFQDANCADLMGAADCTA